MRKDDSFFVSMGGRVVLSSLRKGFEWITSNSKQVPLSGGVEKKKLIGWAGRGRPLIEKYSTFSFRFKYVIGPCI